MAINELSRHLTVFDRCITVTTSDAEWFEGIAAAFVDIESSWREPGVELRLEDAGNDRFRLSGPSRWAGEGPSGEAVPRVVTAINRLVLDEIDDDLCVHAAGFNRGGSVHGLVARSGVGKTTLLSDLMRLGEVGLNDEMLRLAGTDCVVRTWPKPLSVKPGDLAKFEIGSPTRARPTSFESVPLSAVGDFTTQDGRLSSLIFLRRRPGAERPDALPLNPADAMVELGNRVMNFRSVGVHNSLETLAACVASSATWVLVVGEPVKTAKFVREEVERVAPNSVDWQMSTRADEPAVRGCVTIRLGVESVVWSPSTEKLVALDQSATELWDALCHGSGSALLSHRSFARELVDQGLLDLDMVLDRIRSSSFGPV